MCLIDFYPASFLGPGNRVYFLTSTGKFSWSRERMCLLDFYPASFLGPGKRIISQHPPASFLGPGKECLFLTSTQQVFLVQGKELFLNFHQQVFLVQVRTDSSRLPPSKDLSKKCSATGTMGLTIQSVRRRSV